MKNKFLQIFTTVVLSTAILALYSCHENVLINSAVSPAANIINVYSATLPIITHTYYSDSAITSTNIGSVPMFQAVGAITDPFFGTMQGATFFQLMPQIFSDSTFSPLNIFDSAVLVLPYGGFCYGDTNRTDISQTCQVFMMTDTLGDPINENYYSNTVKPIDVAHPLSAPYTFNVYHLRDSFGLNTYDQNYPGLHIPLNLKLIVSQLTPAANSFNPISTTPAQDFQSIFKGVCVRVADTRQTSNCLPYFRLDGVSDYSTASILLYYHPYGVALANPDSDYYVDFNFNTQFCAHFNNITRSYSHFPVNNYLQSTAANDQIVALQNQPGASIDVVIPGLKSLPAGIINKAEIQFSVLPGYNSYYGSDTLPPPIQLYPIGIASAIYPAGIGGGVAYNIADRYPLYSTTPLLVIDGYMHPFTVPGTNTVIQKFTVDIPREVMFSDSVKNDVIHLHINGTSDYYGAFHLVAGGGTYGQDGTIDTNYRAKLIVTYSKLNTK